MTTRVYGCSDDLIEIEGDLNGEFENYSSNTLLTFSDDTVLLVKYSTKISGVWEIVVIKKGSLFDRFEECLDPDAKPYSDQVFFKNGLEWFVFSNHKN